MNEILEQIVEGETPRRYKGIDTKFVVMPNRIAIVGAALRGRPHSDKDEA